MRDQKLVTLMALFIVVLSGRASTAEVEPQVGETIRGEPLDASAFAPGVVETMEESLARDAARAPQWYAEPQGRNGLNGVWLVPTRGAMTSPHSGDRHVINQWGDTSMGIRLPAVADVHGAYFAGQAGEGVWTTGVRAIGFFEGREVKRTDWFDKVGSQPVWFEMDLCGVDRIVIESEPVLEGGGWYAMDDLSFTYHDDGGQGPHVLDFEDVGYKTSLVGSNYAGLTWETGEGEFGVNYKQAIHHPAKPPTIEDDEDSGDDDSAPRSVGGGGTPPEFLFDFQGARRGESGSFSYPPDTHGAVGPDHFVVTVNRIFSIYDKTTGVKLSGLHLNSFLPGSNGDPRVLFDQHSGRWIVIVSDFGSRVYLAVSSTGDATGSWFKTNFTVASGTDAGKWNDYPTLGVDANGIYVAAYMVGGTNRMSIFAIDKAPLVATPQGNGTVTAFRNVPWEGAIQPVHSYGDAPGEYLVSRRASNAIRVRRINPPMNAPTMTELGSVIVPQQSSPPDAPALGSNTPLDTVGHRLMNAVYRDGSIWAAHTVNVAGRAGVRWYEMDMETMTLVQSGTIADGTLYYYFPTIAVDIDGHVVLGFTGSSAGQYASAYYTGRHRNDPPGETAPPVMYKAGVAAQNNIDGVGRNRWGDYSLTSVDPDGERVIYTIQEYAFSTNFWGTWIAALRYGDCNGNGVADEIDLASGTSPDLNGSGVPDECEVVAPSVGESWWKNRYLSIAPLNPDISVAFQVTIVSGPGSLGEVGWVGEPFETGCPENCSGDYGARVVDEPVFRVWTEASINVSDCEIVPASVYEIRATGGFDLFSDPYVLSTVPQPLPKFWADVAGTSVGGVWDGPEGVVNFGDVQATILVFQQDDNAPPKTWTDIAPQETNFTTNIEDALWVIKAFQGEPYPWLDPDQCP